MTRISVCAVQLGSLEGLGLDESLSSVSSNVSEAAALGADLVVLPEIWTPGYFAFDSYADSSAHAPAIREHLASMASENQIHLHGGSFVDEAHGHHFNTSVLFDPEGKTVAEYRKIHLFGYRSREPEVLTPGDTPTVVETGFGTVGMVVCYDLRFPELFRHMVDRGAELVLVASAWPHPRVEAWSTLNRARALENQVYIVSANGVGPTKSGPSLAGHSVIVDPWGTAVASGGDEETLVMSAIDLEEVRVTRDRFRQLADRSLLMSSRPQLSFRRPADRPLVMEIDRVAIAGYTGRDTAAVEEYVAKLEEEGIAPPPSVPMVYEVGADRVVAHDAIDVSGDETCGEIEVVLLVTEDGVHVTVGSDHTDRSLEKDSIPLAKQVVPKVVADVAWPIDEVRDHWDQLKLLAWVGAERRLYQEVGVDFFMEPERILEIVDAKPGAVVFCGTVASITDGFDFDPVFSGRLHDPVLGRSIDFSYESRQLEAR